MSCVCWDAQWNMRTVKWNESGFRPPLCTYRLNWARRTSWGGWGDWDDTVLQTQDSKFEPWRSEAEHATSWSRRLPTILTFTRGWGRNIFCFFQTAETGNRTPNSGVNGSGANHYPRAPALCVQYQRDHINPYSAVINFSRQNLTSVDVRASESDVCRRQILTSKVSLRTVRILHPHPPPPIKIYPLIGLLYYEHCNTGNYKSIYSR